MTLSNTLSPRTSSGSVIASVLVHAVLAGAVVAAVTWGPSQLEAPQDQYVDLGYQTFDAPPEPVKQQQKISHTQSTDIPVKEKLPVAAEHEMQDQHGDVAGTQAASAQPVGSEGTGNASSTPYYKIKPKYPRAALLGGIEGWVLMKIDILETGDVENIRVIAGEQKNTFQDEARRAVRQWKYRPFLDASGKATKAVDHEVRVDFKLAEQEANSAAL